MQHARLEKETYQRQLRNFEAQMKQLHRDAQALRDADTKAGRTLQSILDAESQGIGRLQVDVDGRTYVFTDEESREVQRRLSAILKQIDELQQEAESLR